MLLLGVDELIKLSRADLDHRYRTSPGGEIPSGKGQGTLLLGGGAALNAAAAWYIRRAIWRGKVFDSARGELRNLITPFEIPAIVAKVYAGPSWSDAKPCTVLDYSQTSTIARWVRDEIRPIAPNVYLGVAYLGRVRVAHFALRFDEKGPAI